MDREHANLRILESMADMQWNIAIILEAKAVEAEKVRNWLLHRMIIREGAQAKEQPKEALEVHAQIIEVLSGLTKLQHSLNRNLHAILHPDGGESEVEGQSEFETRDVSG